MERQIPSLAAFGGHPEVRHPITVEACATDSRFVRYRRQRSRHLAKLSPATVRNPPAAACAARPPPIRCRWYYLHSAALPAETRRRDLGPGHHELPLSSQTRGHLGRSDHVTPPRSPLDKTCKLVTESPRGPPPSNSIWRMRVITAASPTRTPGLLARRDDPYPLRSWDLTTYRHAAVRRPPTDAKRARAASSRRTRATAASPP